MVACYAWSNSTIINITNAMVNLYAEERGDLYVRMGPHISDTLISAVKASGAYDNVYCFDSATIDLNKVKLCKIPKVRVFFIKKACEEAYAELLKSICANKSYCRVILPWFYADSVFMMNYWRKFTDHLNITLVEEGTSSYCFRKKEMSFPMFNAPSMRAKLKRYLTEGMLANKFAKKIDTICVYRPEYCRPDIDFKKLALPKIAQESNPVLYSILVNAADDLEQQKLLCYNERNMIYFSSYNTEDLNWDAKSTQILEAIVNAGGDENVIAKVHQNQTTHAQRFAGKFEDRIYVDRDKYIFEGLYVQTKNRNNKALISCISTAAINPKFMFDEEPYVIFTYRLYDGYRQCGVERDDWMAKALIDAYEDKSKVMIPNSVYELEEMIGNIPK